jgi:hypothetical protein
LMKLLPRLTHILLSQFCILRAPSVGHNINDNT